MGREGLVHWDPSTQPEPSGGQHRAPHHQHPRRPTCYLLTLLPHSSEPHIDLWGREGPSAHGAGHWPVGRERGGGRAYSSSWGSGKPLKEG